MCEGGLGMGIGGVGRRGDDAGVRVGCGEPGGC